MTRQQSRRWTGNLTHLSEGEGIVLDVCWLLGGLEEGAPRTMAQAPKMHYGSPVAPIEEAEEGEVTEKESDKPQSDTQGTM